MSRRPPCWFCRGQFTRHDPLVYVHGWIKDTPVSIRGHAACVAANIPDTFRREKDPNPGTRGQIEIREVYHRR